MLRVTRARRFVPVALAAAVLLLSGCDQSPQTAARVGNQTITTDDVHLLAQALCKEQESAGSGGTSRPVSAAYDAALGSLIQSALDAQYAARHHLDYDRLSMADQLNQLGSLIDSLPAKDRARTRAIIEQLFKGQLQVFGEAVKRLQSSGVQPTQQLVQQATQALEADFAKSVKIKVNPRFDAPGPGHEGDGAHSLSRAVSSDAKAATAFQPDASWVAGLPATQRCG
jgi:hypothetical protein